MAQPKIHIVTGAFGYSGRYIARRLIDSGEKVRTLTNSKTHGANQAGNIEVHPLDFTNKRKLVKSLSGGSVLYNTYWIRFNHRKFKQADAIRNTMLLFDAAKEAGIHRVVHVSITNPSLDSPLEYFRGKAQLEQTLVDSGISYAILRPTVLFGKEDILINNIAWMLRKFPVFGVFGRGDYKLQPIHVDDLAKLAVEQGKLTENKIIDAIGPETFTYRDLVRAIGQSIEKPRPMISIPPLAGYLSGWIIGKIVGDVIVTRPEIAGLMSNLLFTNSPPAGKIKLTKWLKQNNKALGFIYANELKRRT